MFDLSQKVIRKFSILFGSVFWRDLPFFIKNRVAIVQSVRLKSLF